MGSACGESVDAQVLRPGDAARAEENAGLGTDHGHGNVMMVLGGGINGGRVYGDWPGLADDVLSGPGDLAITTDYRDVLGEIVRARLGNQRAADVFPDYVFNDLGMTVPR